jgi:hypothetical protein
LQNLRGPLNFSPLGSSAGRPRDAERPRRRGKRRLRRFSPQSKQPAAGEVRTSGRWRQRSRPRGAVRWPRGTICPKGRRSLV